jgi:hypothetical protein
MTYVLSVRNYIIELREKVAELTAQDRKRGDILDSDQLPQWQTKDRPDLVRANVERVYDELQGMTTPS